MQIDARHISRVASIGLGLVFVALISCTLWATARIQRAADNASAAVLSSDRYSSVTHQLDDQAGVVRRHLDDIQSGTWEEEEADAAVTRHSLDEIARSKNLDDRKVARETLALLAAYMQTLREVYRAANSGASSYAAILEHASAEPQFAATQAAVETRATDQRTVALAALDDLGATQSVNVRAVVAATILGLLQLAACALILAGYRGKIEHARRAELDALERASLTDNLTGLGNHRAFQDELDAQVARVSRTNYSLSLAVIDIDDFKTINDRGGHLHGDQVLAELGRLLNALRKGDRAFRVGGDEFAVVLPDTDGGQAAIVMECLRAGAPANMFGATLSIGIASTTRCAEIDAITLRELADAALYSAKQSGRNAVITYADAERGDLVISPLKARAVRTLIDERDIDVVFQPIWDCQSGVPFGFEALSRPSTRYGLAGPQEAFEIAERIGRATALDTACLEAIMNRAAELPPSALLFVNIVPETLERNLLAGNALIDMARRAGIEPDRVVVELTERAMPHPAIIVREVKRIQSLGFKFALDDTGAGNSGLEILRQLAVDYVKIDQAVIQQAMTDPIARAIVASIVAIANAMGAHVIAEGIETAETLAFVRCEVMSGWPSESCIRGVQGYLLGRPAHTPWASAQYRHHAALALQQHSPQSGGAA